MKSSPYYWVASIWPRPSTSVGTGRLPPRDTLAHNLGGCLNVSIDSGKSLTHCEFSFHSFRTSRSGTHRTTEEQAPVRGAADSCAGRASAADADREVWSARRKTFAGANAIVRA